MTTIEPTRCNALNRRTGKCCNNNAKHWINGKYYCGLHCSGVEMHSRRIYGISYDERVEELPSRGYKSTTEFKTEIENIHLKVNEKMRKRNKYSMIIGMTDYVPIDILRHTSQFL